MKRTSSFLALGIGLLVAAGAMADEHGEPLHPYLEWRHYFSFGVYEQEMEAEVSESRGPLPTLSVNLEDLEVDDEHTDISLAYQYRFGERWALVTAFNRFQGDGRLGRDRSFSVGPVDVPLGVGLETDIEIDTYVLDLLYRAYRSPRAEISLGAGVHAFDFYTSIRAFGQAARNLREEKLEIDEFLAPLPNLRVQGFYAFSPRLSVSGALGWLSVDIDEWDGDFRYYKADLSYRFGGGFVASVGYQLTDMDVTRRDKRPLRRSDYDLEFSGPSIHLSYGF